MNLFIEPILSAFVLVLILGFALYKTQSRNLALAALFLTLFALDYTFTRLFGVYDILAISGSNWNWSGKLLSFSWAFLFMHFSFLSYREVGFTFKQRAGSLQSAIIITAGIIIFSLFIGFALTDDMNFNYETMLFYLTMPGFTEEMVYRGVLLALLHRIFTLKNDGSYNWWPAVIATLAFTLMHPFFELNGWNIQFNYANLMLPLLGGAAFVWLREHTGSLLFPMIAHNASNTSFYVMGVL